jgi:WD40 repeat protein
VRRERSFLETCTRVAMVVAVTFATARSDSLGEDTIAPVATVCRDYGWSYSDKRCVIRVGASGVSLWGVAPAGPGVLNGEPTLRLYPMTVTVWNWKDGHLTRFLDRMLPDKSFALAYVPNHQCLTRDGSTVSLFDLRLGKVVHSWAPPDNAECFGVSMSANSKFAGVIYGSGHLPDNYHVHLLDLNSREMIPVTALRAFAWPEKAIPSDDGTRIVVAPFQATASPAQDDIAMIHVKERKVAWQVGGAHTHLSNVGYGLCYSADARRVCFGNTKGEVFVLDAESGESLSHWSLPAKPGERVDKIRCITMSPDGKYLAVGTDLGRVSVCDLKTTKVVEVQHPDKEPRRDEVLMVAFSPDSDALAAYCSDSRVLRVWPKAVWYTNEEQRGDH